MQLYKLFRSGLGLIKDNSSDLAFGFGIGMSIIVLYQAIKAPDNPKRVLDDAEVAKQDEQIEKGEEPTDLTKVEQGIILAKAYGPLAVSYLIMIYCFSYSKKSDIDSISTLGTLLALEKNKTKSLENAAVHILGEKKAQEIKDESVDEQIQVPPTHVDEFNNVDMQGIMMIYNPFSASYFRRSLDEIYSGVNEFNKALLLEGWLSYNDLAIRFLNLPPLEIVGEGVGWNVNITGYLDISFTWRTIDGVLVGFMHYRPEPVYDYRKNK